MVNLKDVKQARERLIGIVHETPLLYSKTLSQMTGNEIYLKCENMQKTGSFKIRGAYNAVSTLSDADKAKGVVTGSSGNHGQAMVYAASLLGVRSVVVMPEDAAKSKIAACEGYGGTVILHGLTSGERLDKAEELVREQGMTLIHPYDNPFVVAGQGTISQEILEWLPDADYILAPIGGGGLLSGVALSAKETSPTVRVLGVEPEVGARMRYSWDRGEVSELIEWQPSVADGIRTKRPGVLNFAITRKYVDDLVTVSEAEIIHATKLILERVKILAEPSGAASVAAMLADKAGIRGKKVVCVISGGNVELAKYGKLLQM